MRRTANGVVMHGVREYGEGMEVELDCTTDGESIIVARNEGGYNSTWVDVLDLVRWLRANRPDLLEDGLRGSEDEG